MSATLFVPPAQLSSNIDLTEVLRGLHSKFTKLWYVFINMYSPIQSADTNKSLLPVELDFGRDDKSEWRDDLLYELRVRRICFAYWVDDPAPEHVMLEHFLLECD